MERPGCSDVTAELKVFLGGQLRQKLSNFAEPSQASWFTAQWLDLAVLPHSLQPVQLSCLQEPLHISSTVGWVPINT